MVITKKINLQQGIWMNILVMTYGTNWHLLPGKAWTHNLRKSMEGAIITRCEDIRTSDFTSLKQWVKTFEPLTFVSLFWKKVAVFIFFRGSLRLLRKKRSCGLNRKFFSVSIKGENRDVFAIWHKTTMIKLFKLKCGTERSLYQMSSPRPFFCLDSKAKKMKPSGFASCTEGALHGTTCRFIRRSRAS